MARRKKSKRRRGPKQISIINLMESYAYANLLTTGIMGNTPMGFITDASDAKTIAVSGSTALTTTVGESVSLSELITHPDAAFAAMQSNFMQNYQSLAVQGISISVGFRLAKRLLRRPLANVNRQIFKPLGMGVKL